MPPEAVPTVLIVEDEPDARNSLQLLLSLSGYPAAAAANGREALDYLGANPPPSLILLDLFMPVMDGVAFLRRRRQDPALAAIPVLVFSGEAGSRADASANGADAYLAKGTPPLDLIGAVARYCGEPAGAWRRGRLGLP